MDRSWWTGSREVGCHRMLRLCRVGMEISVGSEGRYVRCLPPEDEPRSLHLINTLPQLA